MDNNRLKAIYGTALLLALSVAGMVLFGLWTNPPSSNPERVIGQNEQASVTVTANNYRASNANLLNWLQQSTVVAALHIYPTFAPSKPISQTVGDYAVTLFPVYANANRIVLTYTVGAVPRDPNKDYASNSALKNQDETDKQPQLLDERGEAFRLLGETYFYYYYNSPGWSIVFDASHLADNLPTALNLHLTIPQATYKVDFGGVKAAGPFEFDFTMPVDPVRRVAEINQTISTADGGAVTIEKLIATKQDTRVFWRIHKPGEYGRTPTPISASGSGGLTFHSGSLYACCHLTLQLGSVPATPKAYMGRSAIRPNERAGKSLLLDGFAEASLIDKQDEWTIATWYVSTWTGDAYFPDIPGPVFHFTVPPIGNTP